MSPTQMQHKANNPILYNFAFLSNWGIHDVLFKEVYFASTLYVLMCKKQLCIRVLHANYCKLLDRIKRGGYKHDK